MHHRSLDGLEASPNCAVRMKWVLRVALVTSLSFRLRPRAHHVLLGHHRKRAPSIARRKRSKAFSLVPLKPPKGCHKSLPLRDLHDGCKPNAQSRNNHVLIARHGSLPFTATLVEITSCARAFGARTIHPSHTYEQAFALRID